MFPKQYPEFRLHVISTTKNRLTGIHIADAAQRENLVELKFPANDRHPCPPTDVIPASAVPTRGGISGYKRQNGSIDYIVVIPEE